jgi:hypothetical protein
MAFMTDMMAVIFALRMFQLFSPLLHHYDMRCFTPPCCRLPNITQKKESPAPGKHQKISQSQTGFSGLTRWQPTKTNKADIKLFSARKTKCTFIYTICFLVFIDKLTLYNGNNIVLP